MIFSGTKKLISLDFDGPIWNLEAIHKEHILEHYGIHYDSRDVTHWEYLYENYPSITKCWTHWAEYSRAPFVEGALEFIAELKKRYGADALQIVTSTPESIQEEKTQMIFETLGIDVIHVTKERKSLYTKGTILIDDAIHNIIDHLKHTSDSAILFDLNGAFGWNQKFYLCDRTTRAKSYKEILQWLENKI